MDLILGLQTLQADAAREADYSTLSNSCNNSGISLFCGCKTKKDADDAEPTSI